jgi:hypothetical protein
MARRVIKTMAAKMAESGKAPAKDVLDDSDLSDDPIISALQSLRLAVDDLQHNDNDMGMDSLKAAITANTNRGSGTDGARGATGPTGPTGPTGATGSLAITEGYAATMAITSSRGAYTLTINVTGPDRFSKSVALSLT